MAELVKIVLLVIVLGAQFYIMRQLGKIRRAYLAPYLELADHDLRISHLEKWREWTDQRLARRSGTALDMILDHGPLPPPDR